MPPTPDHPRFRPLPRRTDDSGAPRRIGVEIEFAGLTEQETAKLLCAHLGGTLHEDGAHALCVTDSALGTVEVVLDTALRAYGGNTLVDAGLDAARGLVPVEIVTEPLDPDALPRLDRFRDTLRQAGAQGTSDGVLLGFGVHFNIAVVAPRATHTQAVILAFALCEDWLRDLMPIDRTRRILPFVQPWPHTFLTALVDAGAAGADFDTVRALYAEHCNSRNHALDLLPIYKDADASAFASLFPDQTNTKGRPAFHYRLPDSRIDDPAWSLAREWDRWWLVEALAERTNLLNDLTRAFAAHATGPVEDRPGWADKVSNILGARGEAIEP